jgi:hypothetical protein
MRARRFIASLAYTPSLAWAARPLASGAPLCLIGKRSGPSVGVGCPSFGGQRTGCARFSRPRARVVTASNPSRPIKRVGVFFLGSSSQTAESELFATVGRSVVSLCLSKVVMLGSRDQFKSAAVGLTEGTAKYPTPVRQSRAPVTRRSAPRLSRPSGSGWSGSVGASSAPNHLVMGTSCGSRKPPLTANVRHLKNALHLLRSRQRSRSR